MYQYGSFRICKIAFFFHTDQPLPSDIKTNSIFANNELGLHEIDVYGFDYDYTLASYTKLLHHLIFNLGRDLLVAEHKVGTFIIYFSN